MTYKDKGSYESSPPFITQAMRRRQKVNLKYSDCKCREIVLDIHYRVAKTHKVPYLYRSFSLFFIGGEDF